jgi:hypothetical protein
MINKGLEFTLRAGGTTEGFILGSDKITWKDILQKHD